MPSPPAAHDRRFVAAAVFAVVATLTAVLLAVGAVRSYGQPTPDREEPGTSPSPPDGDRLACRAVADRANALDFDPAPNVRAGRLAAAAADFRIKEAGRRLVEDARAAMSSPGAEANIAIAQAQLDVAVACQAAYGDGPW